MKLAPDLIDNLHVVTYCTKVLCCTILTHLSDLAVKVMDLIFFFIIFLYLWNMWMDVADILPVVILV